MWQNALPSTATLSRNSFCIPVTRIPTTDKGAKGKAVSTSFSLEYMPNRERRPLSLWSSREMLIHLVIIPSILQPFGYSRTWHFRSRTVLNRNTVSCFFPIKVMSQQFHFLTRCSCHCRNTWGARGKLCLQISQKRKCRGYLGKGNRKHSRMFS